MWDRESLPVLSWRNSSKSKTNEAHFQKIHHVGISVVSLHVMLRILSECGLEWNLRLTLGLVHVEAAEDERAQQGQCHNSTKLQERTCCLSRQAKSAWCTQEPFIFSHTQLSPKKKKSWSCVYIKHPFLDQFVRHLNDYFRGPIVRKFWLSILSFVFTTALLRFQVRWADVKRWPLIGWRESEHPQRSRDSRRLRSDFRISHTVLFFHLLSRRLQHFVHCCNKQPHTEKKITWTIWCPALWTQWSVSVARVWLRDQAEEKVSSMFSVWLEMQRIVI